MPLKVKKKRINTNFSLQFHKIKKLKINFLLRTTLFFN